MKPWHLSIFAVVVAAFALPVRAVGQPEHLKSAEEIVSGLVDGDAGRGLKGLRPDDEVRPDGKRSIAIPIQFEYDSATITPDSFAQLRVVAEALKKDELRAQKFLVEGHTDRLGSDESNKDLSERRAESVKHQLIEKFGIPAARLEAKGVGEHQPVPNVSQDTDQGRAINRRVVIVNLGPMQAEHAKSVGELAVEVVVKYERAGEIGILNPGDALTPDDNYRVTFSPTRDAYVYVYQIDTSGKADPVFPNPAYSRVTNPVAGHRSYSIPPEGQWLTLDETRGHEEIIVVASERALHDPKAVALNIQERNHPSGSQTVAVLSRGTRSETSTGLFSYRLTFEHR